MQDGSIGEMPQGRVRSSVRQVDASPPNLERARRDASSKRSGNELRTKADSKRGSRGFDPLGDKRDPVADGGVQMRVPDADGAAKHHAKFGIDKGSQVVDAGIKVCDVITVGENLGLPQPQVLEGDVTDDGAAHLARIAPAGARPEIEITATFRLQYVIESAMLELHLPPERNPMSTFANEPATIKADDYTVTRAISIAATIDKVWAAITEPEHLARWFPQRAELAAAAVGARGVFSWDDYGDIPVMIVECQPKSVVAYRWGNDGGTPADLDSGATTVFRFTLDPVDGGTRLTVVETGFDSLGDPAARMEDNRGGWTHELDELVTYLEGTA
jgi:uncharacterized protein YndB with AHSA1/START domain